MRKIILWFIAGIGLLGLSVTYFSTKKEEALNPKKPDTHEVLKLQTNLPPQLQLDAEISSIPEADRQAQVELRAAFSVGDYKRALTLAENFQKDGRRSPQFQAWLQDQMDMLFYAYAWLQLNTGHCEQAIELFKKAEQLRPSLDITKGLAFCYYSLKELDASETQIETFLKNTSDKDTDILLIYSDLLESKGKYAEAVQVLESLGPSPESEALKKKIKGMKEKAATAPRFQSITTKNFILTYESETQREIAEDTLNFLDKSLDDLTWNYKFREPRQPIEVLLYPAQDFLNFNPNSPVWAEALFDGRIRVPIYASHSLKRLESALRHELVHALFSLMTGKRRLPTWFDEGMAQYASICPKACAPFHFEVDDGEFLPAEDFHKPFTQLQGRDVQRIYRQSLYLILTLESRYQRNGLHRMMEAIKVDTPLGSDFLLSELDISFAELRNEASKLWQARYSFVEQ